MRHDERTWPFVLLSEVILDHFTILDPWSKKPTVTGYG